MDPAEEFDQWAADGEDRGMESRHWHTAKSALERLPIEAGDTVVDLGTGSGYALRALRDATPVGPCYGLDASPQMLANARSYAEDDGITFLRGSFDALPIVTDAIDHVFSMEAFYYAPEPTHTLEEIARILRPGGTFVCGVNFFAESEQSHRWQERIPLEMTLWSMAEYREAFRSAGLAVATQDTIPNREIEIPPAEAFPLEEFETREAMVDRYRRWGTLVTVGVAMDH